MILPLSTFKLFARHETNQITCRHGNAAVKLHRKFTELEVTLKFSSQLIAILGRGRFHSNFTVTTIVSTSETSCMCIEGITNLFTVIHSKQPFSETNKSCAYIEKEEKTKVPA